MNDYNYQLLRRSGKLLQPVGAQWTKDDSRRHSLTYPDMVQKSIDGSFITEPGDYFVTVTLGEAFVEAFGPITVEEVNQPSLKVVR